MNTAEQIIDIAQEMVQKRGFHAFSYRDISALVGIRTASIHYYFPTKADLALAMVNRVRTGFTGALARIDEQGIGTVEKLRQFTAIFLETYGRGDRLCPICMLATGQDTIPEEVRAGVKAFWAQAENWVAKTVREGRAKGELQVSATTPKAVGRTVVASLEGAMVAARAFEDSTRLTDVIDFLITGIAGGETRNVHGV